MTSEQTTVVARSRKKTGGLLKDIRNNKASYLLALPALAYVFIFQYLTYPYIAIAFQKFSYRTGLSFWNNQWIGLKNFEFFFKSIYFSRVTWNTVKFSFLFIIFGTFVALICSLLLNEVRQRWFAKTAQSIYLFPHFLSWVVVSYIVFSLFGTEFGLVNTTLLALGMEPISWYSMPAAWTWIIVAMRVWKSTGIITIIFLAAITGIDEQLYEAATVDGATRWQKIKSITIPLLMPTVAILTLLEIGKMMYGDFAMMYAIIGDNGLLYSTADIIDTYVFRALRKIGDPSHAMAVGLYQSLVGFVLVLITNLAVRKYFREGALF